MNQTLKAYAGTAADIYDAKRSKKKVWKAEQDVIGRVLHSSLKPGDRVLDLGAGTGRWLDVYLETEVEPILVDGSADMLRVAEEKAEQMGITARLDCTDLLNVQSLDPCDVMVSTRFFNWIPFSHVRNLVKLSAKAGATRVVFSIRCIRRDADIFDRWRSIQRIRRKNAKVRAGMRAKGLYYLHWMGRVEKMLSGSGFEIKASETITIGKGDIYKVILARRSQSGT